MPFCWGVGGGELVPELIFLVSSVGYGRQSRFFLFYFIFWFFTKQLNILFFWVIKIWVYDSSSDMILKLEFFVDYGSASDSVGGKWKRKYFQLN